MEWREIRFHKLYRSWTDTIYSQTMCTIIDQEWKQKENTCMLFAVYSAMSEEQKVIVTVSVNWDDFVT